MSTLRADRRLLYLVFFVSGAPALVYQVVWQRVLTLYFGVDIYSTTVTVATFMLGLGLGSLVGGRLADRAKSPLTLYLACELGLAAYGAVSLELFSAVGSRLAGSGVAVVIAADFALMLVPTTLMGMTLPLICRAMETRDSGIGRHFSALYAINTLGAAAGALLSAYLLIGLVGLDGATSLAAASNAGLALAVLLLMRRRRAVAGAPAPPAAAPIAIAAPARRRVIACSFLSGGVALGYELTGYRILSCLLHGTTYVFGTILVALLCGIALGSWHARRRADERSPLARFGTAQLALAVYLALLFGLLGRLSWMPGLRHLIGATSLISLHPAPELISGSLTLPYLYSLLDIPFWSGLVFGLPAIFMGYGFPQLVRAAAPRVDVLGRAVGSVYLANIMGATAGSLATGFVALHWGGTEWTLRLLFLLACLTAALALTAGERAAGASRRLPYRRAAALATLALAGVLLLPGRGRLLAALHYAAFPTVEFRAAEDRSGVVALRRQREIISFQAESRIVGIERLLIDGAAHGQFEPGDPEVARDWGVEMALAAHPAPRRVLSVGLGDGKMAASVIASPAVERLVVVELNAVLSRVLDSTAQGRAVAASPKLELIVDDGRRWLLANPQERFDLILLWPLHAAHAYSGNLFSLEFFELAAAHLGDGGLLYTRTADAYSTARTLATVFPRLLRLGATRYVAGSRPLRFDRRRLPISPAAAAATIQADRGLVLERTAGAPLNRDLHPRAEYYITYPWAWVLRTRGEPEIYRRPAGALLDDGGI